MARFPYYKKNVRALGELLARAAIDAEVREALKANPKKVLSDIGLPDQATELIDFLVVEHKPGEKAVSLPFRLNQLKLNQRNPEYLSGIAKMVQ
jgi:hypothetical protein